MSSGSFWPHEGSWDRHGEELEGTAQRRGRRGGELEGTAQRRGRRGGELEGDAIAGDDAHGVAGEGAEVLEVDDGALGFWGALREVFATTREQRCWVHATANILDAMPTRLHEVAKEAIASISNAASCRALWRH